MKRFSLQLWLFVLLLLLVWGIIVFVFPYNPENYLWEQLEKEKMLADSERDSAIVFVGGSNVAFGYDSPTIEAHLGRPVINAGLHFGLGLRFIVEESFPYLKKGDVLVFSPEYEHFFSDYSGGEALADLFYMTKGKYAAHLNAAQRNAIMENTALHMRNKIKYLFFLLRGEENETVYKLSSFNNKGDVVGHWGKSHDLLCVSKGKEVPRIFDTVSFAWLMEKFREISNRGVHLLMLPPVIARTDYDNKKKEIRIVDSMLCQWGIPFVCPSFEMAYPDSLFYDSPYHLDGMGASLHSQDVLLLLEKYTIGLENAKDRPRQNLVEAKLIETCPRK